MYGILIILGFLLLVTLLSFLYYMILPSVTIGIHSACHKIPWKYDSEKDAIIIFLPHSTWFGVANVKSIYRSEFSGPLHLGWFIYDCYIMAYHEAKRRGMLNHD